MVMSNNLEKQVGTLLLRQFLSYDFVLGALEAAQVQSETNDWEFFTGETYKRVVNVLQVQIPGDFNKEYDETTVSDLITLTEGQLLRKLNFGKKSLEWLKRYLALFDLKLASKPKPRVSQLSPDAEIVLQSLKTRKGD